MNRRLFALALAALSACTKPATQLLVVVGSDYAVPQELAGVGVRVRDAQGGETAQHSFELAGILPGTPTTLPFSFTVLPASASDERVQVEVAALDPAGVARSSRRAVLAFRPEESLLLPLFLSRGCAQQSCPSGQSCTEQGCQADDAVSARAVTPGSEIAEAGFAEPGGSGPDGGLPSSADGGVLPADSRRLTVEVLGSGLGRVVSGDQRISCQPTCSAVYPKGSTVVLNAEVPGQTTFLGWTGACAGEPTRSCQLTLDADRSAGIRLADQSGGNRHLYIELEGQGAVRVNGQGICPAQCDYDLPVGSTVVLQAMPAGGQSFLSWVAPCAETAGPTCTVQLQASMNARARFTGGLAAGFERFDYTGDGVPDLLSAAPHWGDGAATHAGRVYLVQGNRMGRDLVASAADRVWTGAAGERLGMAVASPGDLTADGLPDVALGAPGGPGTPGRVYVLPGGALPGSGPINAPVVLQSDALEDDFGAALGTVEDLNNDTFQDLIVGAPWADQGVGRVYVFFGGPAFASRLASQADLVLTGEGFGDHFGFDVAGVPDVTGDGVMDLLVGAPGHSGARVGEGRVYLFAGGSLASGSAATARHIIEGAADDGRLGAEVTGLGDMNGDGVGDLAVAGAGGAAVFFGGFTESRRSVVSADLALPLPGPVPSLAGPGDLDGDLLADLVVGNPEGQGPSVGEVRIYLGATAPAQTPRWVLSGNAVNLGLGGNEGFGYSVGPAGDWNGDGHQDLLVGAVYDDIQGGAWGRGRLTLFYGGPGLAGGPSSSAPVRILGEPGEGMLISLEGQPRLLR